MTRTVALYAALLFCVGSCGKFQQARECGAFVKTVNAWLAEDATQATATATATASDAASTPPPVPSPATPTSLEAASEARRMDFERIAEESLRTARHYDDLSRRLTALHITSDELAPRVERYQAIARTASRTLRDAASALDRRDFPVARRKRVEFDDVARAEPELVKELNGICH